MLRHWARRLLQGVSTMAALAASGGSPASSPGSPSPVAPSVNVPPLHLFNATNSTLSFSAAGDDEWNEDGERIILSTDHGFIKTETYVDKGISDLHTVFLACALTVAPLLGVLFSILGIRYVWKKFQEDNVSEECDDMLGRADTSNPSTRQSLSAEQVRASESQFSVLPIEELDETSSNGPSSVSGITLGVGTNPPAGIHPQSVLPISQSTASSQSSNGSIITLMMKNNTLIVEKQELAIVITRSIPTEGTSAPSVVDSMTVAQPPPQKPSAPATKPAPETAPNKRPEVTGLPPANTGLCQSDTSISSIGSTGHNPGYQYGNQTGYDAGPLGYPSYAGYTVPEGPDRRPPTAPSPWPSADYASLVATLPISTPPQVSFDDDISPEEKRQTSLQKQRQRAHVRTGSCGPSAGNEEGVDEVAGAAARAQKRASLPLLQPLTLLVADERPMRSPVLDKLRLEDALSVTDSRLPTSLSPPAVGSPGSTSSMPKSPPPRSPLAAAPIPEEDSSHSVYD